MVTDVFCDNKDCEHYFWNKCNAIKIKIGAFCHTFKEKKSEFECQ